MSDDNYLPSTFDEEWEKLENLLKKLELIDE